MFVKSGPTLIANLKVWEVCITLPVYSYKLACSAFEKLPAIAEFEGESYGKYGFHASIKGECMAWYRRPA